MGMYSAWLEPHLTNMAKVIQCSAGYSHVINLESVDEEQFTSRLIAQNRKWSPGGRFWFLLVFLAVHAHQSFTPPLSEYCEKFLQVEAQVYDTAFLDCLGTFLANLPQEGALYIRNAIGDTKFLPPGTAMGKYHNCLTPSAYSQFESPAITPLW